MKSAYFSLSSTSKSHNLSRVLGLLLTGFILLIFTVSLFYTPYDPEKTNVRLRFAPPSWEHWLGCDNFGRDLLSRIMAASQQTILISLGAVIIGAFFGILLGLISGYRNGWLDRGIMQFSDSLMAFPGILLALVFVAVGGTSQPMLVLALGLLFIPGYIRLLRSEMHKLREQEFILQMRLLKVPPTRLVLRHFLPCLWPILLPALVTGIANASLAEAGMSYLGLGIQPPASSWGKLLAEAQTYIFTAPWLIIFPSLFLIIYVLGLYFLSEALRFTLDKRSQQQ